MSGIIYIERYERIIQLIKLKSTGSPSEFANKLCLSERTIYRIIKDLKELKCLKIEYSEYYKSYIFSDN